MSDRQDYDHDYPSISEVIRRSSDGPIVPWAPPRREPRSEPESAMEEASRTLCDLAREHAHPTIEALTILEDTVRTCRQNLTAKLRELEEQSQQFAAQNRDAKHCLDVCLNAVEKLVSPIVPRNTNGQ